MTDKTEASYDIDGTTFDADLYVQKILKECSLKEVMDVEAAVIRDTQALHSDMQTLVYENYNKFISATDTMRSMKNEFKKMETEMNLLVSNIGTITGFSEDISSKLQDSRTQLSALSEKQSLLQKLQFLSCLPTKLKQLIEEGNYASAVHDYGQARSVLEQYGNQPSFQGIREDCHLIMEDLKTRLKKKFQMAGFTAQSLTETGELLLRLGEQQTDLSREILQFATQRLHEQLVILQDQSDRDMIEFVDTSIAGFMNDLVLVVTAYTDMFLSRANGGGGGTGDTGVHYDDLNEFVTKNWEKYAELVQARVEVETGHGDYDILLRALDRLYRRLLAMKNLCCNIDMTQVTVEIIVNAANQLCSYHLKNLKESFVDSLSSVRLSLVTGKSESGSGATSSLELKDLVNHLHMTTVEKLKVVVHDLTIFLKPEWSFHIKANAKGLLFIEGIRESLAVGFMNYIAATMTSFSDVNLACPPNLLLVFSNTCLEMEQSGVQKMLALVDELYDIQAAKQNELTPEDELKNKMKDSAQILLNAYVRLQGLNISQMLRKSVETRDWLNCLEPRSVRAVMKRVVEELAQIENVLTDLYESGTQTAASSDSSRKTHLSLSAAKPHRSNWSNTSHLDPIFGSNIHRLFSEKIDLFGPVEFTKVSITTGIIKISLKTLLECVRLRTFSKFGLQQVQVDAHYLQMNLWRFVADENVMYYLLDEILGSAVHRCFEPNLMEPNAVGIICERN